MLIEDIEGIRIFEESYNNYSDQELDEIIEWYEYILEK